MNVSLVAVVPRLYPHCYLPNIIQYLPCPKGNERITTAVFVGAEYAAASLLNDVLSSEVA